MLSRKLLKRAMLGAVAATFLSSTSWAEQAKSKTECVAEGIKFEYFCTLILMQSDEPLKGVDLTVGATMPSMAMAHNIKPILVAEHAALPGHYSFRLQLEMYGEWRLSYDMVTPIRDRLHETLLFTKVGARPGQVPSHKKNRKHGH